MLSAFVTILRDKLIEITEKFRNEDEKRILRVLLSDTNIEKSKFKEQTQIIPMKYRITTGRCCKWTILHNLF